MKNFKDFFQYLLATVIVVAFFWFLILLVNNSVPPDNQNLLNLVVGALIGSFTSIVGYFFGSSKGSAEKTDIIAKQNQNG